MKKRLQEYSVYYPNLLIDLYLFFDISNYKKYKEDKSPIAGTVLDFCHKYPKKESYENMIQPREVSRLCERMARKGYLSEEVVNSHDLGRNRYMSIIKDKESLSNPVVRTYTNLFLCCSVYGFQFIRKSFKQYILPVIHTDKKGDVSIGTCFVFRNGIVSAKHCFQNAVKISVKGLSASVLEESKFFIHSNDKMDLVYIEPKDGIGGGMLHSCEVEELDDVIAMGYPKVAGFHDFLTSETAQVAARFTSTAGNVAAKGTDIFMNEELLLVTAKIKGGNSGGPVLNDEGRLAGVAVGMDVSQGDYDSLGYGTVIPSKFINEIIESKNGVKYPVAIRQTK